MPNLDISLRQEQRQHEGSFTDHFKIISKRALPMAASYTFSIEMFALGFYLNHLHPDEEHAASVILTTNMINSLDVVAISPLFAMSIIVGQHWGALQMIVTENDSDINLQETRDRIARVNHNGMFISLVMLPFFSIPMIFSESIFTHLFHQNPEVASISQKFLRTYAIASPALLWRMCAEQIMFGCGKTKPPMVIALLSALVGMFIAAIFAFGKLGAPKLGTEGVLIGYILEAYLTALGFNLYLVLDPAFKDYHFFTQYNLRDQISEIRALLALGGSILVGNVIEMGSFLGVSLLSGLCGVTNQATFALAMQFTLLSFLLQGAFGQTCTQEISRLVGRQEFKKASNIGKYGILTTLVYVMPAPLLFAIQPKLLLTLLGQNKEENYVIARILFPILATAVFLEALRYQWLQQLRNNLNDAKFATIYSSCSMLLGVILAYLLGTKTTLNVYGVGLGYVLGLLSAAIPLGFRWYSKINDMGANAPLIAQSPSAIQFFPSVSSIASDTPEVRGGYTSIV
jgi:MATE family multidrug resistance protein